MHVGSSPLTRGKPDALAHADCRQRLIPAHAGKTAQRVRLLPVRRAHPRSRGENKAAAGARTGETGSSPLTRGKPDDHGPYGLAVGLIPAHAGKTDDQGRRRAGVPAHPRSRGENGNKTATAKQPHGSSPLTRGKRRRGGVERRRWGLIPAHAGKTAPPCLILRALAAHPRSRGENEEGGLT